MRTRYANTFPQTSSMSFVSWNLVRLAVVEAGGALCSYWKTIAYGRGALPTIPRVGSTSRAFRDATGRGRVRANWSVVFRVSTRRSGGHDRRRERHPMVLCPRRSQRCPRAVEYVVGPLTEDGHRLALYVLGVEEMDVPAACAGTLSQHLAVHDGVGTAFIGCATLDVDVVGEVKRPPSQRHRHDRFGYCGCQFVQRSCRRPDGRCSHLRNQGCCCGGVEKSAFVMDRCCRHAGFDQVDPPAIHDLVVGRCGDSHGPAEMMSDTHTHDVEYGASHREPRHQSSVRSSALPTSPGSRKCRAEPLDRCLRQSPLSSAVSQFFGERRHLGADPTVTWNGTLTLPRPVSSRRFPPRSE